MRFCLSPLLADGNAALTFYLRLPTHNCSMDPTADVREETSESYRGPSELARLQDRNLGRFDRFWSEFGGLCVYWRAPIRHPEPKDRKSLQ